MKKAWIFSILTMFIIVPALAISVCAKNSVVSVVLDPSIAGNSYTYNNSTGVWKTVFSYGNVSGVSTCLSVNGGSRGRTNASLTAVGGEVQGQYCWCKMTHPMSSLWAFSHDGGNASACASYCASDCGYDVQGSADLRGGLFGSVAAANAAF